MTCFSPLELYRSDSGEIRSYDRGGRDTPLSVSCGQCIGCRLRRSMDWAVRCTHEARMHEENCFVTLTYSPDKVPHGGALVYHHFQDFMKRLRFHFRPHRVRFFMGGEYGEEFQRPHYHACLFGVSFQDDRVLFKELPSGHRLYTSERLSTLWGHGFVSLGDVSFESAAYVARYCTKKVTGKDSASAYERFDPFTGEIVEVPPEFGHMSLKPGIGSSFMDEYLSDVFPEDRVILGGRKVQVPKFYDKYLTRLENADLFGVEYQRYLRSLRSVEDSSIDRLRAREICTRARLSFKSQQSE